MDDKDSNMTPQEIMRVAQALRLNFESQAELFGQVSKLYRARFESLVSAGFTEVQALEIVKARGLQV